MKRIVFLSILSAFVLSACGVKGDLYLPQRSATAPDKPALEQTSAPQDQNEVIPGIRIETKDTKSADAGSAEDSAALSTTNTLQ